MVREIYSLIDPIEIQKYKSQTFLSVVLVIMTLGLYGFFWQYKQMKCLNALHDEKRYQFSSWLVLTIISFGLYHLYHEYVMGCDIIEYQVKAKIPKSSGLSALSILLTLISFGILTDAIQQYELNKIIDRLDEEWKKYGGDRGIQYT